MTPIEVGYISLIVLVVLLFSGIHIGVVMGLIGFLGMVFLSNWSAGLGLLKTVPYTTWANYDFSVIPLFLLMGEFCNNGGISEDMYKTAHTILGKLKGGLGMATIGACALFSAVSGSSVAEAAAMCDVALPEMKKYKYDSAIATGSLAAGGTLGVLIPPSVTLVIYGMLTQQSIGKLYTAGVIPGIMQTIMYIALLGFLCYRNPLLGPPGRGSNWKEKLKALESTWIVVVLFLLVIGGMQFGVFSPTEGAGVGAACAFFFAVARRKMNWTRFKNSILETAKTSAMCFFIILGAMILNYFLAVTRLPFELAKTVGSLQLSPYVIWAFIVVLYLVIGALMDEIAMMLLTVPILFPVVTGLGFDPIWFGVMVTLVCEMGMICPPVGIIVFVINGMTPEVSTYTIYRGSLPYVGIQLLQIVVMTAFPAIITWLPAVASI
jgi:C4-dicarboxylate transporter, DctM subunit